MNTLCVAEADPVQGLGDAPHRTCRRCGCRLRRSQRRDLCDACWKASVVPASWHPRCDAAFAGAWLTHLLAHFGSWCHASDVFPSADHDQRLAVRQCAYETVVAAERFGLVVEHDNALGYRVTGWSHLPKYLRLKEAEAETGELPGQLAMLAAGAVE